MSNNNIIRPTTNLELQLLPSSSNAANIDHPQEKIIKCDENNVTKLKLSLGSSGDERPQLLRNEDSSSVAEAVDVAKLKQGANEQLRMAMAEKAFAEEARQEAKRQMELAEMEFGNAKRIRQQAQNELEKAQLLREESIKKINETISEITCHSCKQKFHHHHHQAHSTNIAAAAAIAVDETSPAMSYMSSATTDAEGE